LIFIKLSKVKYVATKRLMLAYVEVNEAVRLLVLLQILNFLCNHW
jgi:hypothetical protein